VAIEAIDPKPGAPVLPLFRRFARGEIRFLWILGSDPLAELPDPEQYRRAAARGDRFLVVSDAYPTRTTDAADLILPSTIWFEREGISANAERRVQYRDRLVAPPGEATGDAWQMIEVARRLGFQSLFAYEPRRHVEQIWEEFRRFHADSADALPPLVALRAQPGALWPWVAGREVRWPYHTTHDPAADQARGEYDFYDHQDHRAWIWLRPHEPPAEAPDQEYPFWLSSGAVIEHSDTGTLTRRIPTLHQALPHSYVEIHREDAQELGIRNRDPVRLVSRRGAIELEARVDYRSQPPRGLVFVPSFDESVPVNRLTLDAACPLSGQPEGSCAVRLEPPSRRTGA
jgi:nitrate reductase NapA